MQAEEPVLHQDMFGSFVNITVCSSENFEEGITLKLGNY
jgi:hypothetical protein